MSFQEFIKPELLALIPVMYIIGIGIKKSSVADKFIPLILGCVSVMLCGLWVVASTAITSGGIAMAIFTAITQGVLIAGAAVYADQIVKQAGKDK